jgi:hypothetical protein
MGVIKPHAFFIMAADESEW